MIVRILIFLCAVQKISSNSPDDLSDHSVESDENVTYYNMTYYEFCMVMRNLRESVNLVHIDLPSNVINQRLDEINRIMLENQGIAHQCELSDSESESLSDYDLPLTQPTFSTISQISIHVPEWSNTTSSMRTESDNSEDAQSDSTPVSNSKGSVLQESTSNITSLADDPEMKENEDNANDVDVRKGNLSEADREIDEDSDISKENIDTAYLMFQNNTLDDVSSIEDTEASFRAERSEYNYDQIFGNIGYEMSNNTPRSMFVLQPDFENHAEINKSSSEFHTPLSNDDYFLPQCDIVEMFSKHHISIDKPVWHSGMENSGPFYRQEIQISEVIADRSFMAERQITEWVSVGSHAAGRGPLGLTLVTLNKDRIMVDSHDFNDEIDAICIFQWWDLEENSLSTGLMTSQDATITWHELTDENEFIQIWAWELLQPVIHLNIFYIHNLWKLAVTHEKDSNQFVNLYGLNLWKDWWFEQRLSGVGKIAVINEGKYIALSENHREAVIIYEYDAQLNKYVIFYNIASHNIVDISSFTAGGNQFLAIGASKSSIYQIKSDNIIQNEINNIEIGYVDKWLPIQLDYLRNDVMVVFQHQVHSHTPNLQALQWNGKHFVSIQHSRCTSKEMFGLSCIVNIPLKIGLKGATIFQSTNNGVNLLTAGNVYSPMMYKIKTEMKDVRDPINEEIDYILTTKQHLEDRMLVQHTSIDKAKVFFENIKNFEEFSQADNWKYKELRAPVIRIKGQLKKVLTENATVKIGGKDWKQLDLKIDLSHIAEKIKNNHIRIKNILIKLKDLIKNRDTPHEIKEIKIKGGIKVGGKIKIKNAHIGVVNGAIVDDILMNSVKIDPSGNVEIGGIKMIKNLQNSNIHTNTLNGINLVNIKNNTKKPISLNGDVNFLKNVYVKNNINLRELGTVNNIDLNNDIYTSGLTDSKSDKNVLVFEKIEINNLTTTNMNGHKFTSDGAIEGTDEKFNSKYRSILQNMKHYLDSLSVRSNISFDFINGRNWTDFISRVVSKNDDIILESLNVHGNITVDGSLRFNLLNKLVFPNDFVMVNETSNVSIQGKKYFLNEVVTGAVDCEGTINGIRPSDFITLTSNQNLRDFTFHDLTVTEKLNIAGEIKGTKLIEFPSNPTLKNTKTIHSNTRFQSLKVNGDIIIGTNRNDNK